jgi:hypothetical protein
MAIGIVQQGVNRVPGDATRKLIQLSGDAAYPTGGYPITAAALGFQRITKIEAANAAAVASLVWDPAIIPTYSTDGLGGIASFNLALAVSTTGVQLGNGVTCATGVWTINVEGN